MKKFLERWSIADLLRTFGAFVVSFVLGLVLRFFYPSQWYFREQVGALGDAFLVAGIVGFCIEAWAASILIGHVSEELSLRLVGYGLPKPARMLIRDLVKTKRVYREYRKVFRIVDHPATPETHVLLCITLSYIVVNNDSGVDQYAPTLAEEGMYNPRVVSLQYRDLAFDASTLAVTIKPDTKGVHWNPPNNVRLFLVKQPQQSRI
jgi:hypothetical protein